MKKLFFAFCALAVVLLAASCKKDKPINVDDLAEDGVYVFGAATGFDNVDPLLLMANGINEAKDQTARDGMFEKYIVLEGGKEFSLVWVNAGTQTLYGAELKDFTLTAEEVTGIYDSNPVGTIFKGKLVTGDAAPKMKMATTGLYHIVLDLNKNNDLSEAQILVAPVEWGVRGGMNNWGFTKMEATPASNSGMTYVLSGQELGNNGDFKFSYNGAWKITLDDKGEVKANTNLGTDGKPGGSNIVVTEGAGKYKITLNYKLAAGAIENCFTYKTELQEAASYPENVYMTGTDFGGWSWGSDGIVTLQHISAGGDPKDGCFVTTRYFKADNGFKFSTINVADDWSKAFGGMTTNSENITFDGDGNAHVPSDGLWTITLDYTKDEMTLTEGQIYGMGKCFGPGADGNGDWTTGKFPGVVNADGTATITALFDGALRVYAPCAFDWWQHEFQPDAEGNLVYREGGELEAFNVTAGQEITFDFNAGTATVGAPFVGAITIDGDMSDWATVTTGQVSEKETPVYMEFKVTNDEKYMYFYSKRDLSTKIWASAGYFYFNIDGDNNPATGEKKDSIEGLENWVYFFPFGGTADAPAINTEVSGGQMSGSTMLDNIKFAGKIGTDCVEIETRIPLTSVGVKKGDVIGVNSWGNKSGDDLKAMMLTYTVL